MSWLNEVNWDNIGKAANNVTSAANAINAAADQLNKSKVVRTTVNQPGRSDSGQGGDNSSLMLLALAALFFGGK